MIVIGAVIGSKEGTKKSSFVLTLFETGVMLKAIFGGSKGNDFLTLGVTNPLEPFLAKFFHWGTPQGPRKV